jgi:hypothetical protein
MRVMTSALVWSSLLIAAGAAAGGSASTPAAGAGSAGATGSAAAGSGTGAPAGSAAPTGSAGSAGSGSGSAVGPTTGNTPDANTDLSAVKPEDMPTDVRIRRLEQQTQALKERAWQLKARMQMLKEQTLGGGVGAQALITHANDMGAAFRLTKLSYTLDGTEIFSRNDDDGQTLYSTKSFDIFNGPIAPGSHNLASVATYRGHGYGVFEYLSKFTFTARNTEAFTVEEGKIAKVDCKGYERGGASTQMEKRPALDCKATELAPKKGPDAAAPTTPGTTPLPAPAATPAPAPAAAAPAATPGT